jgi:hypothetical protein
VPALTVDRPTVTVTPGSHLRDGQTVEVQVTGFGVGGMVRLSECASAAEATDLGCGLPLSDQALLVTDEGRASNATFTVRANVSFGQTVPTATMPCTNRCVIVATLGPGFGYAVAPIAFGAP